MYRIKSLEQRTHEPLPFIKPLVNEEIFYIIMLCYYASFSLMGLLIYQKYIDFAFMDAIIEKLDVNNNVDMDVRVASRTGSISGITG